MFPKIVHLLHITKTLHSALELLRASLLNIISTEIATSKLQNSFSAHSKLCAQKKKL